MRFPYIWRVGSYGTGKRHWHVYRRIDGNQDQLVDARGRTRWFATQQAAQRAASIANQTDAEAAWDNLCALWSSEETATR